MCGCICGTFLTLSQVKALLPIPAFGFIYTPLRFFHGRIKNLILPSQSRRVLDNLIHGTEGVEGNHWRGKAGLMLCKWPKVLPELYKFPQMTRMHEVPWTNLKYRPSPQCLQLDLDASLEGRVLVASEALNGAAFDAFLESDKETGWDVCMPIDLTQTRADIIYEVADDEGPIQDVCLRATMGEGSSFNPLVSLPALNPIFQSWDILLAKEPVGKLRIHGIHLGSHAQRKKFFAPEKNFYWGNTWYTTRGFSQPSKAQWMLYNGFTQRDQKGNWSGSSHSRNQKERKLNLGPLYEPWSIYLLEDFPSKNLQDTLCDPEEPYARLATE